MVKVMKGITGEKSLYTLRETVNNSIISDDSSRSCLDADIWPYAQCFCMPSNLHIFSTWYKLNYYWCLYIITYRTTKQISQVIKIKFVLEGSLLLVKNQNVAFSNNEFLKKLSQIFSQLCASWKFTKGATTKRHNFSVRFMYLTEKNQQNHSIFFLGVQILEKHHLIWLRFYPAGSIFTSFSDVKIV